MELLERMLEELHDKTKRRAEAKLKMFYQRKQKEKEEKLAKLRKHHERGLVGKATPQQLKPPF